MKYNKEQGIAKTYPINNEVWKDFKSICKNKRLDIQPQIQEAVVYHTEQLLAMKNNPRIADGSSKTFRITGDKWDVFKNICNELGLILKQQVQEAVYIYTEKLNKGE